MCGFVTVVGTAKVGTTTLENTLVTRCPSACEDTMDPDETLNQLRALASKLEYVQQADDEDSFLPDQADLAQEYADLFSALDE